MLKKIVFGLALFLACVFTAGLYYAYQSANSTPVANGSQVVIDSGGHHIEGTLRPSATYQYLLKDEGFPWEHFQATLLSQCSRWKQPINSRPNMAIFSTATTLGQCRPFKAWTQPYWLGPTPKPGQGLPARSPWSGDHKSRQ